MKSESNIHYQEECLTHQEIMALIDNMIKNIKLHPSVNNEFYRKWTNIVLPLKDIELILANYFARTIHTVERVFDTMKALIDVRKILHNPEYRHAALDNMRNLHEELGSGYETKLHVLLLRDWINAFLKQLGSKLYPIELSFESLLTKETMYFINEQKRLYNNNSPLVVIGASFAQETIADYMLKNLCSGYLDNYHNIFKTISAQYKTTEYFSVHIFGVEAEHSALARKVIIASCKTSTDFDQVKEGFNNLLKLTVTYWDGLNNQLSC